MSMLLANHFPEKLIIVNFKRENVHVSELCNKPDW